MNRLLQICWLLPILCACAASTTPDRIGGETHFLGGCINDCGAGLQCVCGVCTLGCSDDNSCRTQNANATCEAAGTPIGACETPSTTPVCDVRCDDQSDCTSLGTGYTCERGSCRKLGEGECINGGVLYSSAAVSADACLSCLCSNIDIFCAACSDGGMDAGITLPEPACLNDDADAGAIDLQTVTPRVIDCPALNHYTTLSGARVLGSFWNTENSIVVNGGSVFWSDRNHEPYLQRADVSSGNVYSYDVDTPVTSIASDGCHLHYAIENGIDVSIDNVDVHGGEHQRIANTSETRVSAIALTQMHTYFWAQRTLYRVGRGGGDVVALYTVPAGHNAPIDSAFVATATHLYWIDNDTDLTTARDSLMMLPTDGSQLATALASDLATPSALIVDGEHLYITLAGTPSAPINERVEPSIARVSQRDGAIEVILRVAAGSIAVDATHLYWLEGATSAVALKRIAKASFESPMTLFDALPNASNIVVDDNFLYIIATCSPAGGYVISLTKN